MTQIELERLVLQKMYELKQFTIKELITTLKDCDTNQNAIATVIDNLLSSEIVSICFDQYYMR